jgi:hypothetical protein
MRRFLLLMMLAACAADTRLDAACTASPIGCGQHPTGRLEQASCRFNNTNGPYFEYYVDLNAGASVDIFMTSNTFRPRLQLYRGSESTPVAFDSPATTITELQYEVRLTARYYIVASGENATGGAFQVDFYCLNQNTCLAPFAVRPLPFSLDAAYGGVISVSEGSDGTPPFHYRWYDEADPSKTLGEDSPDFITPALFKSTRFVVHVTNACGGYDDFVRVNVAAAPPKPPRRRSVGH